MRAGEYAYETGKYFVPLTESPLLVKDEPTHSKNIVLSSTVECSHEHNGQSKVCVSGNCNSGCRALVPSVHMVPCL